MNPWQIEPDEKQLTLHGFSATIKRVPDALHLCGYLTLPAGHPWTVGSYDGLNPQPHGGWTFGENHSDGSHTLGFDCAHYRDLMPGHHGPHGHACLTYRTMEFVEIQLREMACAAEAAWIATK